MPHVALLVNCHYGEDYDALTGGAAIIAQTAWPHCLHCTRLLSRNHQEIIKSGHEFQPIRDLVKDALPTGICQGFISGIETADYLPDCSGKGSAVCVGRYTPQ